jgi:hypothetical protein
MNALTFYHLALTAHIIGLTLMAGTTIVNAVLFRVFWKQFAVNQVEGAAIYRALSRLNALFVTGFLLLLISGVAMMYITKGAFGEQTWFRIKFALILIIVINSLAVGRGQGIKLRMIISGNRSGEGDMELRLLKRSIYRFLNFQILFFIFIFVLSVFKPN